MQCRAVVVILAFGLMLGPTVAGLLFGNEPGFRVMITRKGLDYGTRYIHSMVDACTCMCLVTRLAMNIYGYDYNSVCA